MVRRAQAFRAVGAPNARNPLPTVLLCYRIVESSGKLTTRFSGHLELTRALLA